MDAIQLGREIKEMRLQLSMTQEEVASLVGLEQTALSGIERGRTRRPRGDNSDRVQRLHTILLEKLRVEPSAAPKFNVRADVVCPKCLGVVPGPANGAMVCLNCAHQLARRCPACRQPVPFGWRYCGHCGVRMEQGEGEGEGEGESPQPMDQAGGERGGATDLFGDDSAQAERQPG